MIFIFRNPWRLYSKWLTWIEDTKKIYGADDNCIIIFETAQYNTSGHKTEKYTNT